MFSLWQFVLLLCWVSFVVCQSPFPISFATAPIPLSSLIQDDASVLGSLTGPGLLKSVVNGAFIAPIASGNPTYRANQVPGKPSPAFTNTNYYFNFNPLSSCSTANYGTCSATRPTSWPSPLTNQLLSISVGGTFCSSGGAYLQILSGLNSTAGGTHIVPWCESSGPQNSEAFQLQGALSGTSFQIQAWNTANGTFCISAAATGTGDVILTLAPCDASALSQQFQFYPLTNPTFSAAQAFWSGNPSALTTTEAVLYNLGLGGVFVPNSPIGTFTVTDVVSGFLSSVARVLLFPAKCPAANAPWCEANGRSSPQLTAIYFPNITACPFITSSSAAAFVNIWGGIGYTANGATVQAFCNTGISNNEVFYLIPQPTPLPENVYLIQAYSTSNGAVCLQSSLGYQNQILTLQSCDPTNPYQLWGFLSTQTNPNPPNSYSVGTINSVFSTNVVLYSVAFNGAVEAASAFLTITKFLGVQSDWNSQFVLRPVQCLVSTSGWWSNCYEIGASSTNQMFAIYSPSTSSYFSPTSNVFLENVPVSNAGYWLLVTTNNGKSYQFQSSQGPSIAGPCLQAQVTGGFSSAACSVSDPTQQFAIYNPQASNSGVLSYFTLSVPSFPFQCTNGAVCPGQIVASQPNGISRFIMGTFINLPAGGAVVTNISQSVYGWGIGGSASFKIFPASFTGSYYYNLNVALKVLEDMFSFIDTSPKTVSGEQLVINNYDVAVFELLYSSVGNQIYATSFGVTVNYYGGSVVIGAGNSDLVGGCPEFLYESPSVQEYQSQSFTYSVPALPLKCTSGALCSGQTSPGYPSGVSRFVLGSFVGLPASGLAITSVSTSAVGYTDSVGGIEMQIFPSTLSGGPKYNLGVALVNGGSSTATTDSNPQNIDGGALVINNYDLLYFDLTYFSPADEAEINSFTVTLNSAAGFIPLSFVGSSSALEPATAVCYNAYTTAATAIEEGGISLIDCQKAGCDTPNKNFPDWLRPIIGGGVGQIIIESIFFW